MSRFGEQRLVREDTGLGQRLLFRVLGVADPAHYLHHRYLRQALERHVDQANPQRILDAGCGTGDHAIYLAQRYPRAEVVGVDISPERVATVRQVARQLGLTNTRFEPADLTVLPFANEFDFVFSIDVLEHIIEQRKALSNLAGALRPGGIAFFHIPTARPRPVPFSRWLEDFHSWAEGEHLAEELTPSDFTQRVRETRLEVMDSRATFGYLTGELATSLFALPYRNTPLNRVFQVALAPLCRLLALADSLDPSQTRYAVAVLARRPPEPR